MPMGLVSDDEFDKEFLLNHAKRTVKTKVIGSGNHGTQGRQEGDKNVPESLRKVIAQEHIENGRESANALAREFGISPASVSAYSNSATSTRSYHIPDEKLRIHNREVKERIAGKAQHTLIKALKQITPEKLGAAKLRDVSAVARDMSVIIKQMEPVEQNDIQKNTNVQVVLYAPRETKEEEFPRVVVSD